MVRVDTASANIEPLPDVAVPRNKIYAAYVDLCARERLKPLNAANFGRCVKMVYPEVKTRRLGVRGESKYHYCGIRLVGDDSGTRTANLISVRKNRDKNAENDRQRNGMTTAINDVFKGSAQFNTSSLMRDLQRDMANQPAMSPISQVDFSMLQKPTQRLVYLTPELAAEVDEQQVFELPQIYDYLPDDADADVQEALVAAYYLHCINLIEAVASMRIRQFMELNQSFYHALAPDVQSLLGSPSLATWVQKADLQTYQHITRILTPLTHQVIPPEIFLMLRNLSMTLLPNIHQSLAGYAPHLLQPKLIPAGNFASLLSRLLRVNETAHAAARFLTNSADRELMRMDWIRFVDPKAIAYRELSCGEEQAVGILDEILNLLGPSKNNKGIPSPTPNGKDDEDYASKTVPVLDLWQKFLSSLPNRFPSIEPRLFLLCMGAVESSVLRDITVAGGEGFGALWVVRCWVDEMMRFLCERGGFLLEQVYDSFDDDEDDLLLDDFNSGTFLFGGGQIEPLLSSDNNWGI